VEFEQGGKVRAEYGKQLLVNLAKDLTLQNGKGFNRTNLTYMRKLYLAFPKCGTLSHKLTWSHYYEILKCDAHRKPSVQGGFDLKRAEIRHNDIGQMNLYLNYFKTEVCQPDDNPPIGIVLGAKKDELLMEYALQGITNQLFAARYQLYLPKREELQEQLDKLLEGFR